MRARWRAAAIVLVSAATLGTASFWQASAQIVGPPPTTTAPPETSPPTTGA
ncbi:MAG: hypothetical protein JO050_01125, partial [Acidimicrobiia bacterium]|nr:hypothetical protein [Acidimicrobiia bacterium]